MRSERAFSHPYCGWIGLVKSSCSGHFARILNVRGVDIVGRELVVDRGGFGLIRVDGKYVLHILDWNWYGVVLLWYCVLY